MTKAYNSLYHHTGISQKETNTVLGCLKEDFNALENVEKIVRKTFNCSVMENFKNDYEGSEIVTSFRMPLNEMDTEKTKKCLESLQSEGVSKCDTGTDSYFRYFTMVSETEKMKG